MAVLVICTLLFMRTMKMPGRASRGRTTKNVGGNVTVVPSVSSYGVSTVTQACVSHSQGFLSRNPSQ